MTKQYKVGDRVSVSYYSGNKRLATVIDDADAGAGFAGYTTVVFDDDPERHKCVIGAERLSDEPFVDELYFSELEASSRALKIEASKIIVGLGFVGTRIDNKCAAGVHLSPTSMRELAADLVKLARQLDAE